MKRCVFMTLADRGDYVIDDDRAVGPLAERGIAVESVPWDDPAFDWGAADLVVIRSPWDYFHRLDEFLSAIERIAATGVAIENSPDVVRWNSRKTYLRELEERGVCVIPTLWHEGLSEGDLAAIHRELDTAEIVIKPVVSANAMGTWRLDRRRVEDKAAEIETYFARTPSMAQPLARYILEEGEYSLFYFNGRFSHCVLKAPASEDFRVQEEHGGLIAAVPASSALHAAADAVLDAIDWPTLYARVDLVRRNDGDGYWLMELELIEPSLYLRTDPQAPERFADAVSECLKRRARGE